VLCAKSQPNPSEYIRALVCGLPRELRLRRLLVMLQGYVDDSGSEGTRSPFVLAGYILPAKEWELFSDDWKSQLEREPRITYFKMMEAAQRIKQFSGFSEEFCRCKVKDLLAVIHRHNLDGIYSVLSWNDYREILESSLPEEMRRGMRTAYGLLFFNILDTVVFYQRRKQIGPEKVDLDFDEQGEAGEFARMFYPLVKEQSLPEVQAILGRTPTMLDDKNFVALQAADLLAWSIRREFDCGNQTEQQQWHWLYEEVDKTVWLGTRFGKRSFMALRDMAIDHTQPRQT